MENEAHKQWDDKQSHVKNYKRGNGIVAGIIIVVVGLVILVNNLNLGMWFPHWMFTWPMILIIIGIIGAAKSGFRGGGWIIPVIIGLIFLAKENNVLPFNVEPYILPAILIALGLFVILKKKNCNWERRREAIMRQRMRRMKHHRNFRPGFHPGQFGAAAFGEQPGAMGSTDEYLDVNSVFAHNEQRVLSKSFKGGRISCSFGGAEVDLSQADFEGTVTLDISASFGGVELLLPGNWVVKNELSVILGGVDDKRRYYKSSEQPKILILTGNIICGGVEIKSY